MRNYKKCLDFLDSMEISLLVSCSLRAILLPKKYEMTISQILYTHNSSDIVVFKNFENDNDFHFSYLFFDCFWLHRMTN